MSDIKSMIKSRRDQRYYGSSFEKRSQYTDETRLKILDHRLDEAPDDGTTFPEEVLSRLADRNMAQDDNDLNLGRSVDDPNPVPKEQPKLDEIAGKAHDYAASIKDKGSSISTDDLLINRQALLDKGYTEDDIQKFQEMYEHLQYTKNKTKYDALDNARRIDHMQTGWGEPDE